MDFIYRKDRGTVFFVICLWICAITRNDVRQRKYIFSQKKTTAKVHMPLRAATPSVGHQRFYESGRKEPQAVPGLRLPVG